MEFYKSSQSVIPEEDRMVVSREQVIPDEFAAEINDAAQDWKVRLDGFTKVASIPTVIWDKWRTEGKDPDNASVQDICKWLRKEDAERLIISGDFTF